MDDVNKIYNMKVFAGDLNGMYSKASVHDYFAEGKLLFMISLKTGFF